MAVPASRSFGTLHRGNQSFSESMKLDFTIHLSFYRNHLVKIHNRVSFIWFLFFHHFDKRSIVHWELVISSALASWSISCKNARYFAETERLPLKACQFVGLLRKHAHRRRAVKMHNSVHIRTFPLKARRLIRSLRRRSLIGKLSRFTMHSEQSGCPLRAHRSSILSLDMLMRKQAVEIHNILWKQSKSSESLPSCHLTGHPHEETSYENALYFSRSEEVHWGPLVWPALTGHAHEKQAVQMQNNLQQAMKPTESPWSNLLSSSTSNFETELCNSTSHTHYINVS